MAVAAPTRAIAAVGGILCSREQADQLHHFWDGSMETARMLSVVMKAPLWQIRSWAQSCGLPPASDAVKTKWPPEPHPEDERRVIVTEVAQSPLPALTEDQQTILKKVWTGAGEKTRQAAAVIAHEFGIQPWQVRAWATHLGIAEPNLDEFHAEVKDIVGAIRLPELPEPRESMAEENPPTTKKCFMCGHMKPFSAFRRSPRGAYNLTKCCIDCLDKQARREQRQPIVEQQGPEALAKAVEIMAPVIPDRDPIPQLIAPRVVDQVEQVRQVEQLPAVSTRYEMLYTLLRDLPESGRMVESEYERWWAAFAGVFGYLVRIEDQGQEV